MTLTRLGFTITRMMLAVAGAALTLAYVGSGSTRLGCGSASVRLTFHVVDARDGQPIAGASIELIQDGSAPPAAILITGTDGSAQAVCKAGATWYSGPFFRRYRCLSFREALRVQADGYQSVEELLQELTSAPAYHNSSVPLPVLVRLKRLPRARRGTSELDSKTDGRPR